MNTSELRTMGKAVLDDVRTVLAAYPVQRDLTSTPLTNPTRSAQSFGSPYDYGTWIDLCLVHGLTKHARNRHVDSYLELRAIMPRIEEMVAAI